ncbi:uncharacterized protein B0P05DRAFT_567883 [Gilbertella persicaria]|uniref:uncharacterized protein n=1 Tax=Gilbertella persicaria TaxID=101096 RepID=UPI00221F0947|nr:uncharacterized protein B0P05DRAFT_567883 [Gilbertella persicaria]KAI8097903.1 hypothetical protein B0P05DRAFT_567883 [Gilbertella persicaria]
MCELLSVHISENHTEVPNETNVFQGNGGLVGNQSSLSDQTEKTLNHKVTDEEDNNINPTDLFNECKIDERSKKIIECLNLKPLILQDEDEDKQRMLCFIPDSQRIHMFKNNNKRLKLIGPSSTSASTSNTSECVHTPKKYTAIDKIIRTSPYCELLSFKKYMEVNEEQLMLLNTSWRSKPYLSLALSQLLAGSILANQNEALLINGIESYSQFPSVDAHCEKFIGFGLHSSMPNLTSSYPNELRFTAVHEDNSKKLIISSRSANFLVISSIRIDEQMKPEVGPTTMNFIPTNKTSIYLDTNSIKKINCKDTNDAVLGSKIMIVIADAVHTQPLNPQIKKGNFTKLAPEKKKTTSMHQALDSIISLFENDLETLQVIGNTNLASVLRNIADSTTASLKHGNRHIVENIWNYFKTEYKT